MDLFLNFGDWTLTQLKVFLLVCGGPTLINLTRTVMMLKCWNAA